MICNGGSINFESGLQVLLNLKIKEKKATLNAINSEV